MYTPCLFITAVAALDTSDNAEQSARCELCIYLVLLITLSLVYVRCVDIQQAIQTRSHERLSGLMPSSEQKPTLTNALIQCYLSILLQLVLEISVLFTVHHASKYNKYISKHINDIRLKGIP
jgi:hypothetical protein